MAKAYQKSNREIRKPKKTAAQKSAAAASSSVTSVFVKPVKSDAKPRKG